MRLDRGGNGAFTSSAADLGRSQTTIFLHKMVTAVAQTLGKTAFAGKAVCSAQTVRPKVSESSHQISGALRLLKQFICRFQHDHY